MTNADLVEQVPDVIGPDVAMRDVDAFLDAVKDTLVRATTSRSGVSTPSSRGTARPARRAIPEQASRSRVHRVLRRSSSRRVTSAAVWTWALACPGRAIGSGCRRGGAALYVAQEKVEAACLAARG